MKVMSLDECRNALVEANIVTGLNEQVWFALGWCQTVRRAELPGLRFRKEELWIGPDNKGYEGRRPDLIKSFDAQHALAKAYGIEVWNGYRILAGPYDGYWRATASETIYIPGKDFAGRMKAFPFVAKHREWAELGALLSTIEYKQAKR